MLAFDDGRIEHVHDFVQWLFPLREPSRAVPDSPVLTDAEAIAIRADQSALDGFGAGLARMARFYSSTDGWLTAFDHNHLRITRIVSATRELLGRDAASNFLAGVMARTDAGSPVNAESLRRWAMALG